MSIKTPDLSHLSLEDYESVYEPAEDSFLVLDALEKELSELNPSICVEIGSGSGILSVGLASALKSSPCLFIATDINARACTTTTLTAERNKVAVQTIQTDALFGLEDRLAGRVDVILCNPPYVCTPTGEEVASMGIQAAAWDGGPSGRRLTDKVIALLPRMLSPDGRGYVVVERSNNLEDVRAFASELGLLSDLVIERRAGIEWLSVLKLTLKKEASLTPK